VPPITSEQGVSEPHRRGISPQVRQPLRLALPADPVTPSVVRLRVREWLMAWRWPEDELDEIVLALSEAVSNAIEHAYVHQPLGVVEVRGGIETTPEGQYRATIIVRDHGRWRPPPRDHENRRRGIPLMQACMESVTIRHPPDDQIGTCVVLRSKTVPAHP
jgi:serine/threonine-protein kinase RsbW